MDNNIIMEDKNIKISFMDFVNSIKSFFTTSNDIEITELDSRVKAIENKSDMPHIRDLEKYVTAYTSVKKAIKTTDKKPKVQINREIEQHLEAKDSITRKQSNRNEDNELSIQIKIQEKIKFLVFLS